MFIFRNINVKARQSCKVIVVPLMCSGSEEGRV